MIKEGDKVKLDIKSIMSHPNYDRLTDKYRSYVLTNANKIFTVTYEKRMGENPDLVTFKEDNTWIWREEDLIVIKDVK